jgi:hypothetical protein
MIQGEYGLHGNALIVVFFCRCLARGHLPHQCPFLMVFFKISNTLMTYLIAEVMVIITEDLIEWNSIMSIRQEHIT